MTTENLIEKVTWALVEATNTHPDMTAISKVLESALGAAILTQEQEKRLKFSLVRNASVVGEPLEKF